MNKNMSKLLEKLYSDPSNEPASGILLPDSMPTPSPGLNWATGVGGIIPGSFVCWEGPQSSGKSLMALYCVAESLKRNKDAVVIWYDSEGSYSRHFTNIVLPNKEDSDRLIVRKHCTEGAQIFDYFTNTVVGMMDQGLLVSGCVVDSLQSIRGPKETALESTEKHIMGDLSGYLPKALRLISDPSKPRLKDGFQGVTWHFISQVRDNLSPDAMYSGQKYTISGGRAFKHALDLEILLEKIESKDSRIYDESLKNMNESKIQIGHRVRAKIQKNRLGPPSRIVEFDIEYDKGIVNQWKEIAVLGTMLGILTKEGNTHYYKDRKLAVGEEASHKVIQGDVDLQNQILADIMRTSNDDTATAQKDVDR